MSFYKCTECNTFFTQKWPLLKGHLKNHHHHTDLDEAKVEDLVKYEITEQEYLTSTGKDQKGITVDNGTENREPPPPPPPGNQNPPPAGSTNPPLPEKITEYVDEPVERLRQVLIVNEAEPRKITTITNIMALSPWLWANWRDLEEMLVSHFGTGRRQWCQMVVAQYQAGVKIPQEGRYMYPYQGVPLPSNLGQPFNYQNPYLMPPGGWTPPAVNPEMSELKNELNRLREERQREHEKQYEDRIKELESKISGGSEVEKLRTEIEDLKKQLSGGGQANYMVIMDEKGQPMQLPYDRSFMEALRRKQEVETESARTEQMLRIMAINGGGSDKYESMMAELKKDREDANKRIEELTKQITDQRIQHLEERVRSAEDMVNSGSGDGKGVLDVAQNAGQDLKEAAVALGKGIQDNIDKGIDSIREVITNKPTGSVNQVARSPQQIAAIMQGENDLLNSLGVRPNA